VVGLLGFFKRVMDGFCGPRPAAILFQEEIIQYSKKLVIEPLRQFIELLRQFIGLLRQFSRAFSSPGLSQQTNYKPGTRNVRNGRITGLRSHC
jgi:hypothetical protein